jgi:hypothetical protein
MKTAASTIVLTRRAGRSESTCSSNNSSTSFKELFSSNVLMVFLFTTDTRNNSPDRQFKNLIFNLNVGGRSTKGDEYALPRFL